MDDNWTCSRLFIGIRGKERLGVYIDTAHLKTRLGRLVVGIIPVTRVITRPPLNLTAPGFAVNYILASRHASHWKPYPGQRRNDADTAYCRVVMN